MGYISISDKKSVAVIHVYFNVNYMWNKITAIFEHWVGLFKHMS
jgi:hypothetical protein